MVNGYTLSWEQWWSETSLKLLHVPCCVSGLSSNIWLTTVNIYFRILKNIKALFPMYYLSALNNSSVAIHFESFWSTYTRMCYFTVCTNTPFLLLSLHIQITLLPVKNERETYQNFKVKLYSASKFKNIVYNTNYYYCHCQHNFNIITHRFK